MKFVICINNFESKDTGIVLRNRIALESLLKILSKDTKLIVTGIALAVPNVKNISLKRTGLDIGMGRDIPFIRDILSILDSQSDPDSYIGYLNRDLILKPTFFQDLENIFNKGYDSVALMHEDLTDSKSLPFPVIKSLPKALKHKTNIPFFGRDGFIFHKKILSAFKDCPDFLIGEAYWDVYFYERLLRKTNMYDDCIRPTLTRHVNHSREWNRESRPGWKYNSRLITDRMPTKDFCDIITVLKTCEKGIYKPEVNPASSKDIFFYNECHTGDCLLQIHYLRKLILKNRGIRGILYVNPQEASVGELRKFIGVFDKRIILDENIKRKPSNAVNCWIGRPGGYYQDPNSWDYNRFYVKFFKKISAEIGLKSPIQSSLDMLIDNEEILRNNRLSRPYDYLIINSMPRSGQLNYNEAAFRQYLQCIVNRGRSCVTTKNLLDEVPSTMENGLSLIDIGNLSLFVKHVVGIHTAPIHCTFNIWNQDDDLTWTILHKRDTFTFNDRIRLLNSIEALRDEVLPPMEAPSPVAVPPPVLAVPPVAAPPPPVQAATIPQKIIPGARKPFVIGRAY